MKEKTRLNKATSVKQEGIYSKYLKRLIDFSLSLFAVIILSPVMIMISIIVKIILGSPVIFKQQRPGLNEKIFTMYKFRTMTDKRNENGELLPDSVRLTKFGSFLRSTSLDELPELFNIIKGERGIIETTKKNADFSRVVTVNSISL
jgi:undecaprenyl phosphate N,N'-diacetylbacillosamine 1-phosphate transferase